MDTLPDRAIRQHNYLRTCISHCRRDAENENLKKKNGSEGGIRTLDTAGMNRML